MNSNAFREISQRLNVRDVARYLGLEVNRAGFINCPLHSEKTASCRLYDHRFWCFGCQTGGDSIDLVAAVKDVTKSEAAAELNSYFSLGVDLGRKANKVRRKPRKPQEDAGQVKRLIDLFADTARAARSSGVSDQWLVWIDEVHQGMIEDMSLDPVSFIEKWKGEIDRHADIISRRERINTELQHAGERPGEYTYPKQQILEIMGRS